MEELALVVATASGVAGVIVLTDRHATVVPPAVATSERPGERAGIAAGRALLALVVFASIVALSGWIVPAAVVAGAAWWGAGSWSGRHRHGQDEVARVEALATWIEHLRDVLLAGDQPVGAISATVSTCPPAIAPQVRRLAAGLGRQDPDLVLRRFADEIDDPLGDLVAAGLSIAVRRGARTAGVLTALAEHARTQTDRRRVVEAERAPTRREVSLLTAIMAVLVLALFVFGRSDYLAAYETVGGQVFLSAALLAYVALLVRIRRLARFPRAGRFLSAAGGVR